ncbi:MAG: glycosyltransferase [Gemmatimonadota bacterium]|nr:glycosyltransferase [Gemmatimonadota bacterium]
MPRHSTVVQRVVAHFLPWLGVGGTEHATLRIAEAVRDRGFRSVVFCRRDATEVLNFFQNAGIETIPYDASDLSFRRPLDYVRSVRKLASDFRRLEVDVLHCADVQAGVQAALAGRVAGIPVLCHVRNPWPSASWPVTSRRERLLLSAVNTFVFVSRDTWAQFARRVTPDRGRVLYDGILAERQPDPAIAAEVRRELGLGARTPVVGMVARVAPQKDYLTLARAAARVLADMPNVRFIVVGDHDGNDTHRKHFLLVREALVQAGVLDSFIFTGFRTDVSRVMRVFDLFVLSTHFEGLPLVILEAMAMGLPVIATAVNGIPEVIDRNEVGRLFAHEDDVMLAHHIISLLSEPARGAQIGEAGRESVLRNFSPDAFANNLLRLYAEAMRGRT